MKKILIVEDEIVISEDIKMMANNLGYTTVGNVYNGDKVSDKVSSTQPDLVLLDINIKGTKNGLDVALDLQTKNVPFVFISSYSDEETLSKVKKLNPVGYLVKPFNIDQLRVLLQMAFFNLERQGRKHMPTLTEIEDKLKVKLTKSEYQITLDIADGLTYDEIAGRKFISINTVKSHIRHIYNKFHVTNKVELINLFR